MIGQSLVLVCATLAIASGSICQSPLAQGISQQLTCGQSFSPVVSSGILSSVASPVVARSVSVPVSQVVSAPVSTVVSSPVVSGNCMTASPVSLGSTLSGTSLLSGSSLSGASLVSGSSLSGASLVSGSSLATGVQVTDGPQCTPITVAQAPSVTLPVVQTPIIALPSQPIPAPKVLSQRCICTKTIVKPQIFQRVVTAPKLERYMKRTVTPVVENVSYKSAPISQGVSSAAGLRVGSVAASCGLRSQAALVSGLGMTQRVAASLAPVSVASSPVLVSRQSVCSC